MSVPPHSSREPSQPSELDKVVDEVVSEAHVQLGSLRVEERQYLKAHALKKPLGVLDIWALGVGVVITGAYFGWNQGLVEGGPLGMLLASLYVCVLYMMWVLALSELSVAMPFAGGPLAYGRRAVGPAFGFVMGWSMFLEALFAAIGTAMATGGYIYFVLSLAFDTETFKVEKEVTTTVMGLATVALFAVVQWVGSKRQAQLMEWMTYGAIFALVWFWIACIPGVRWERIVTTPLLTAGWTGVLKAIPYAIWWLVMIETVALAPEEAHEPQRTIPRGMTLAQITLVVLVLLTWFFASAAADYSETGADKISYPLPFVYQKVWPNSAHLVVFSVVAIFGMIVSYNGMIYAVSRQSFALGRAGYLPQFLGHVHPVRRTPDASIIFWSVVIAGFVVWGYFNEAGINTAVLTCNLTALIWYVLAIACLFILRWRDPHMPRPYKVPCYPFLPALVLVMSLFAAGIYAWYYHEKPIVLYLTLIMYAAGLGYYFVFARRQLVSAAPEELAARGGHEV